MKKSKKTMNKVILYYTYFFFLIFFLMIGYFVYFLLFESETYNTSSYNPRLIDESDLVIRGDIYSADGEQLATTHITESGNEIRVYSYSNIFSHVIGYSTNGMSGLEQVENSRLLTSHSVIGEQVQNQLNDEKSAGDNLYTTLDTISQKAVYNAFGNQQGAFIAMDPETGAIISMVSKPDFNPNTISDDWASLIDDSDSSVLLNRVMQGKYAPGSTFKILTALEYLREGGELTDRFTCNGSLTRDNYTIHCFNNRSHGNETLLDAFGRSCNVAFSEIGLSLDLSSYKSTVSDLLIGEDLPDPLGIAGTSSFTLGANDSDSTIMVTSFGQGKTLVTPYNMMLISAAIANDGTLMTPYLVDHVENAEGTLVSKTSPSIYGRLISSQEADTLSEMMRYVVTNGTGTDLDFNFCDVYGKTGTAEYNDDGDSHSWFVGFADDGEQKIAFACIVEGTDEDTDPKSMPVVSAFLKAYYQ